MHPMHLQKLTKICITYLTFCTLKQTRTASLPISVKIQTPLIPEVYSSITEEHEGLRSAVQSPTLYKGTYLLNS